MLLSLRLRLLERLLLWLWLWQLWQLWQLLLRLGLLVGHGGGAVVARVPRGGSAAPWVDLCPGVDRWQGGACARGCLVWGGAEDAVPVCEAVAPPCLGASLLFLCFEGAHNGPCPGVDGV